MHEDHQKQSLVIGGGYAGLTAAVLRANAGDQVTLVDQNDYFLNLIHLHKSTRFPVDRLRIPHAEIAGRHGYNIRKACVALDLESLMEADATGTLNVNGEQLRFDSLIIATGSTEISIPTETDRTAHGKIEFTLEHVKKHGAQEILSGFKKQLHSGSVRPAMVVVGGGATGLQFLFELDAFLTPLFRNLEIHLIDLEDQLLEKLSPRFHDPVARRLTGSRNLRYHPRAKFLSQSGRQVFYEQGGARHSLDSDLTFLFPGVRPHPQRLHADAHGRLVFADRTAERVYVAGDCSHYDAKGSNAMTAQIAVRKARLVSRNIDAQRSEMPLHAYDYHELGYFVSLGPWDGIGWMVHPALTLTGMAAFAAKEAIEAQFGLFLNGIDSYSLIE